MQSQMLDMLGVAINTIADPYNFLLLIAGTAIGVVMGMLPGLGGTVTLALLIPITFGMDPLVAFMLLVAANGGTSQGGAVTAILLNTPGKAPNAATLLDGYPMARQGRGGEAVGASLAASALGAIAGLSVLVVSIPIMVQIVLLFGPPEIFWLGVWGLTVIAIVVGDSLRTGLVSAGLGLLFAMHGVNEVTAGVRWTYGIPTLLDGVQLVPALIGLFAVSEMLNLVTRGETIAQGSGEDDGVEIGSDKWKGVMAVVKHKWIFLRSAVIGTVIGAIPGVGGTAANYVAYFQAVQTSSHSERFGTGDVRGVIASEAANDAKEGGAYIPTLGFGIPGSSSMAILFGAFLLHGITPGPLLLQDHLDVVMVIIVSALVSNVVSSALVLVVAEKLVAVTKLDIRLLAPIVIAVAFLASYALKNDIFAIWITLVFGVLGFLMIYAEMSRIPMVLGLVLGPIVEQNFFRSLMLSSGDAAIFVRSPITWALIGLSLLSLFLPYIRGKLSTGDLV
ncbi:MAG: tripartite tricarboxylate transporter permease [Haloferacaceae archaeon]